MCLRGMTDKTIHDIKDMSLSSNVLYCDVIVDKITITYKWVIALIVYWIIAAKQWVMFWSKTDVCHNTCLQRCKQNMCIDQIEMFDLKILWRRYGHLVIVEPTIMVINGDHHFTEFRPLSGRFKLSTTLTIFGGQNIDWYFKSKLTVNLI